MQNNRLKIMRKINKKTQMEIAEYIGISQNAYSYWENGKVKIDADSLRKLADYYKVSLDFISGRKYRLTHPISNWRNDQQEDYYKAKDYEKIYLEYLWGKPVFIDEFAATEEKENAPDVTPNAFILNSKNIFMIPVYESVSAGFGTQADNNIVDYTPVFLPNATEADESLCIKVQGDSMFPKIENGDLVIVHKQSAVDSGSIAVVLIDGTDGLVKKVVYGDNWIELHSINPMYPIQRFDKSEMLRIQILGQVKKIIKNV